MEASCAEEMRGTGYLLKALYIKKERAISRILFPVMGHDHFTRMPIARHLLQPTRKHGRAALDASLFGLAPNGVYPAVPVTRNAVSSYLAISPLPDLHRAVYFLWHFPPVARSSCYEPSCPAEFGLSSPA